MAQTMVNFRMDEDLKKNMDETCKRMGLTMTAAFTMFAVKVTREQRIPFEVTADPFAYVSKDKILSDLEESRTQIENGQCYDMTEVLDNIGRKYDFV